ncbi:MAG: hypothetical protein WD557_09440 [Dehalococcoidia bacterium]
MALARMNPDAVLPGGGTEWPAERPNVGRPVAAAWRALGINREALSAVIPVQWAVGVPAAVVTLIVAGSLLQPAPATEATGSAAVMEAVIANVLMVGLLAAVMGAMSLRRWGMGAALGVSLFATGLVLSCPVSGHHTFGLWFAGQSACVMAATGLAAAALVRTKG